MLHEDTDTAPVAAASSATAPIAAILQPGKAPNLVPLKYEKMKDEHQLVPEPVRLKYENLGANPPESCASTTAPSVAASEVGISDQTSISGDESLKIKAHPGVMEAAASGDLALVPKLTHAISHAQDTLSESARVQLWARMYRKMISPDCPPLLAEKWKNCGNNKDLKGDVFNVYLACGGNVGLMEAYEKVTRTWEKTQEDTAAWMTLDTMLEEQTNYRRKKSKNIYIYISLAYVVSSCYP